ncbi:Crotonase superfamily [Corchorus olitorius]|uniref:3-hydroxyisobutyryl-CoA hydrolase n=1 Tax=Corchorus olitorius TaxID=93759 RepID=A0A1R3KJ32_9ROSI|nr:Crotonase superfamily [Corchorus olitorius]
MASSQQEQVLVEAISFTRILTLNRTKQLNALSFEMVSRLLQLFLAYENDPNVKLIIVKGKGRAFCAGGDVAAVVRDIKRDGWRAGANFFSKEFTLNYLMATYSKPQVSILDGIVMGGGAGVSVHGRFRIATENSVFAMPETALGLFPDVGASYYLSRLPGFFGEYVGLTGSRLDGAEMLACGLATHFVPSAKLPMLEAALSVVDSNDPVIISSIIDQFCEQPLLKEQSVYNRLEKGGSKVSVNALFGCRAILLDKDKNPKWEPSKLELITKSMVDVYFSKVDDEEWEDLKLPTRSKYNLSAYAIAKL